MISYGAIGFEENFTYLTKILEINTVFTYVVEIRGLGVFRNFVLA